MSVKVYSRTWLASPGGTVTDFVASVTARNTSTFDRMYGMVFGINGDWSQYYAAYLSGKSYSIWKWSGTWTALQDWTTSSYVATGPFWNRLKVLRSGINISLYANDHLLTTIADSSFTGQRRFGFAVSSPSNGLVDARFKDFALYPVSCGADAHAPTRGGFQPGRPDSKSMAGPPPPPK